MVQIRLTDGQHVNCASVDLSHEGWVVANIPGECVQHIPRDNVHRILSRDGSTVSHSPDYQHGEP